MWLRRVHTIVAAAWLLTALGNPWSRLAPAGLAQALRPDWLASTDQVNPGTGSTLGLGSVLNQVCLPGCQTQSWSSSKSVRICDTRLHHR